MRTLSYYEFTGILVPGVLALACGCGLYPELRKVLLSSDITVGGFGLFVIVAYVVGHLVQSVGNVVEWFWWKAWGGMPTDHVRSGKGEMGTCFPAGAVVAQVKKRLGLDVPADLRAMSAATWFGVTRQIYAELALASMTERVDVFNGNYGLNRGVASALLVVILLLLVQGQWAYPLALLAALGAGLSLGRMHRFAKHYAVELFAQFLRLPK